MHDYGGQGAILVIRQGLLERGLGDGIPAIRLDDGKGTVDVKVESVMRAEGDVRVLGSDGAGDAE